jgi:hypothetical protein
LYEKNILKLGMVVHAYNTSTQEAEARGLRIGAQSGLNSEIFSLKKEKKDTTCREK